MPRQNGFHDRLLVVTLASIAAIALLGVTFTTAARRCRESPAAMGKIRNRHVAAALLLSFVMYTPVSAMIFRMFVCDSPSDGNSYLRADHRMVCTSAKHRVLQVYSVFMAVVYTGGIPFLYLYVLLHWAIVPHIQDVTGSRERPIVSWLQVIIRHDRQKVIGVLWKPYRAEVFYFEIIECGRRIMLSGVVVFILPGTAAQIAISFIVALLFTLLSEVLRPY
ncbi:unnamed protein product, partial [Discosporangium mesarthrocarpum]